MQFSIELAGDTALIIRFDAKRLDASNHAVGAMSATLSEHPPAWLVDVVPAYNTLLVYFDALRVDHFQVKAELAMFLRELDSHTDATVKKSQRLWRLPCWYQAPQTPDLERVSHHTGLSEDHIVTLHQSLLLTVYAIGFAPGFAFLGELPEALATPRLETPRKTVPAGAVALANRQAAVYPSASPGGWNLIGLCPAVLFSAEQTQNEQMRVGDSVRFYAITEHEYRRKTGMRVSPEDIAVEH